MIPIVDFHCDLLSCVAENETTLTFDSPETNCSVPQLWEGGVRFQTLALFGLTEKGSVQNGARQIALYAQLLQHQKIASAKHFTLDAPKIHCAFALENASVLLEEDEPLSLFFSRLETLPERVVYISLTWNMENRFGGGNATDIGLKPDGRAVLDYLDGKGIAIDLSHTSDALAYDILNYINDKKITPIASHSNYRAIAAVPRNLPDPLALEIIQRGGVIGLNFVRRFIGDRPEDFLRHIEHGLSLGAEGAMCFGADFYGGLDHLSLLMPGFDPPIFQPHFPNSGCYQRFLALLGTICTREQLEKIAHKNALRFLLQ